MRAGILMNCRCSLMPWIENADEKEAVILNILNSLPDWFGIPESIADYGREGRNFPCYTVEADGKAVGFVSIKQTSDCAAEVHVMGIVEAYHRQGLGKRLIGICEDYCRERALPILHVKTLDNRVGNSDYLKTYAFYRAMGFLPLEVLPLWDEENQCLLLVKYIV